MNCPNCEKTRLETITELRKVQKEVVPKIEWLEDVMEAADQILKAVTFMKIDGWLDGEYDLLDQQYLSQTARDYIKVRYPHEN